MKYFFIGFFLISISINSHAQYSFHESIGWTPTAFNLQNGESRYTNTDLILNAFAHGISDNLSINAGAAIYSGSEFYAMTRLKYTYRFSQHVRLAIAPQINYSNSPYIKLINPQLTGILTIGKPKKFINFSYSAGIDFTIDTHNRDDSEVEQDYNYLSIGGSLNLSRTGAIFTEHIIGFEGSDLGYLYNAHSFMARTSFKEKHQLKFGFVLFAEYYTDRDGVKRYDFESFPLPVIAYSYHWGLGKKNK